MSNTLSLTWHLDTKKMWCCWHHSSAESLVQEVSTNWSQAYCAQHCSVELTHCSCPWYERLSFRRTVLTEQPQKYMGATSCMHDQVKISYIVEILLVIATKAVVSTPRFQMVVYIDSVICVDVVGPNLFGYNAMHASVIPRSTHLKTSCMYMYYRRERMST